MDYIVGKLANWPDSYFSLRYSFRLLVRRAVPFLVPPWYLIWPGIACCFPS